MKKSENYYFLKTLILTNDRNYFNKNTFETNQNMFHKL